MLALREGVSCVCTFTAWITVGISTTRMRNLGFTIGSGNKAPNFDIKCDKNLTSLSSSYEKSKTACLDVEKEARVSEKEVPSATERSFVTTSRGSPSQPSVVWLAEVA